MFVRTVLTVSNNLKGKLKSMKEKQLMTSNGHYRNFGTEIYRIAVSKLMKAVID